MRTCIRNDTSKKAVFKYMTRHSSMNSGAMHRVCTATIPTLTITNL